MRKNQLFLVACFVSVSFFALSSFIDSNAWGETLPRNKQKKCKKELTFNTGCMVLQDLSFIASWSYTDLTSTGRVNNIPTPGFEIDDTVFYSVGIAYAKKKFLSQALIGYQREWSRGAWDFFVDPFEFNAGVQFSRQFNDIGQNVVQSEELKDEFSFNVGVTYNLPMENLYWLFKN